MSDPVTNVEIEDVLSSIRRLVSDGDKARTRDPFVGDAPKVQGDDTGVNLSESSDDWPAATPEAADGLPENKNDKLVLTPAFLVVARDEPDRLEEAMAAQPEGVQTSDADHAEPVVQRDIEAEDLELSSDTPATTWADETKQDETFADGGETASSFADDVEDGPLTLTDMVFDDDGDRAPKPIAAATEAPSAVTLDQAGKSDLAATIAELEAAISKNDDDFEPDGSEVMSETIAWPGSVVRHTEDIEDAEAIETPAVEDLIETAPEAEVTVDTVPEPEPETELEVAPQIEKDTIASFESARAAAKLSALNDVASEQEARTAEPTVEDMASAPEPQVATDVYGDDDIDDLIGSGAVKIDEEALRTLVSDVVREELSGPLGERITRNVRKLVRREIYRILSSQEFD